MKISQEACKFIKKKTLVQVFSCEFCEVFRNNVFTEHLRVTASNIRDKLMLVNMTFDKSRTFSLVIGLFQVIISSSAGWCNGETICFDKIHLFWYNTVLHLHAVIINGNYGLNNRNLWFLLGMVWRQKVKIKSLRKVDVWLLLFFISNTL